jgi:8-oxo-dGTP pyrophosphatase MutT (NUDIX family)
MNEYNINKPKLIKKKKGFCGNCGKYGHIYSKCREPVTSLGIINFKIDNKNFQYLIENFYKKYGEHIIDATGKKNIIVPINDTIKCPTDDTNKKSFYLKKFCLFQNSIKFLMIRRKNTLGYIEFIRGHYEPDDTDSIISLFQQMVKSEIEMIEKYDLDTLWNKLWLSGTESKIYEFELKQSREKFNKLKDGHYQYDLYFFTKNVKPEYDTPEWGFPKGRRNFHEKNLDCAIREFNEESGYNNNDYKVLKRLHSLNEVFLGTNEVRYKHIYYISINTTHKNPSIDYDNPKQAEEIGDIGWFTFHEATQLIRPYHKQRKKILTQLYMFLVNRMIDFELDKNN